jgi:hypothetical protein
MAERGLVRAPVSTAVAPPQATMNDVSPKPSKLLGAPMNIEYEAVIQGETADADFDLFADTIRRRMEQAGAVSAVGRSLTWTSLARQRTVHISVVSRNGKTTIRAAENMESLGRRSRIIGMVGGAYLTMGVSAAVVPAMATHGGAGVAAAVATGLVTLSSVLFAARYSFGRSARKRQARLKRVVEELMEQVSESIQATRHAISSGDHRRLGP